MFIKCFFLGKGLKMEGKRNIVNKLGMYLLGTAFGASLYFGAVNYANAQDASKVQNIAKSNSPKSLIYSGGSDELTTTGDGIFAKSYINNVELSPKRACSLMQFYSKDKINYSIIDVKKGLEQRIKKIGHDSTLTKKEKAFKYYLKKLSKKLKSNDKESLKLLNTAVKDGYIDPVTDTLYDEKGWKIKGDTYMAVVKTKKQEIPILLYFKLKNFEDIVKEGKLEKEAKKTARDSSGITKTAEDSLKATAGDTSKAEQFYEMTSDTVRLLKQFGKLTDKQKIEWGKLSSELKEKGYEWAAYGIWVKRKEQPRTKFGLEAALGTEKEAVVGVFYSTPLASWLSLEGFGDWYAAKGNPLSSGKSTQITARERELMGAAKYKQRTDEIITSSEEKAIADAGLGLTFNITDWLEIPLRAGATISKEKKTLDGKSTIIFEGNSQSLQVPSVITNTKDGGKDIKTNPYISAGTRFNITKHLSAELSAIKRGEIVDGRVNFRYNFLR